MMGVGIAPVVPEDAEQYGLPSVSGALVNSVDPEKPAGQAGIREGDVIVAINDLPVAYPGQLQQRVAQYRPGDEVTVKVYRNRRPMDIRVRLTEAPLNEQPQVEAPRERVAEQRLGIHVEPLTRENAQEYGFDQAGGVVISEVEPGSEAQRRQVIPGSKILSINGTEIANAEQVREALQRVRGGDIVSLRTIHPQQGSRIANVRMPE
jgi:serine protease Do